MTATLIKLAFAGIRSRALASALTILLSSAAAATIVLALEVGATVRDPWQRTFDAANGAHVIASVPSEADARRIGALPGIAERDAPVPSAQTTVTTSPGHTERLALAGLRARARVDAPVRTEGSELREGGIVLERSLADALGLQVGTTLQLAAPDGPVELRVIGTAISPSQPRYPRQNPGVAWVTRATLERIEPDRNRWVWTQAIRLPDPSTAPVFAELAAASVASLAPGMALVRTWQQQRDEALRDAQPFAIILTTYTIVLLVVVFAVVAILVGARASQQHREIGLLKAVGLTPRQITTVFALESAALGLVAVVVGFSIGAVLAPRLAAPSSRDAARLADDRGEPVAPPRRQLPRPARPHRQRPRVHAAQHALQRPARAPGRRRSARVAITPHTGHRPGAAARRARARPQGPPRPAPSGDPAGRRDRGHRRRDRVRALDGGHARRPDGRRSQ